MILMKEEVANPEKKGTITKNAEILVGLIDGSVETQLQRMREHLKTRGTVALQAQGDLVTAG